MTPASRISVMLAFAGLWAGPVDDNATRYFGERRRARWLGEAGATIGKPYVQVPLAGAVFASGRPAHSQRFRDDTYDIAQAFVVNAAFTTAIKYAVQRERPDRSNKLSFPSGHTSNAFAWAAVASHHYGRPIGIPGYLIAGLVGVSRMERSAHHLSDVLGGATLGYLVGRTVVRRDVEKPPCDTRLRVAPVLMRSGVGIVASVQFPGRRS